MLSPENWTPGDLVMVTGILYDGNGRIVRGHWSAVPMSRSSCLATIIFMPKAVGGGAGGYMVGVLVDGAYGYMWASDVWAL